MPAEAAFLVLLFHRRDSLARAEKNAAQVRFHLYVPLLSRELIDRVELAQAGVVDEHVEPARLAHDFLEGGLYLRLLGHVTGHGMEARAQLVPQLFHLLHAPRQAEDVRAFLDQHLGHHAPQPAAGARNDNDFAF